MDTYKNYTVYFQYNLALQDSEGSVHLTLYFLCSTILSEFLYTFCLALQYTVHSVHVRYTAQFFLSCNTALYFFHFPLYTVANI